MRLELTDFSNAGKVSFGLENFNLEFVEITADIISSDLTNLATAINNQSSRTGVQAYLSANKNRLILESASGKDIYLSDITKATQHLKPKLLMRMAAIQVQKSCLVGWPRGWLCKSRPLFWYY